MIAKLTPSAGVKLKPIRVSRLIEAANAHLARYGDTAVSVAISTPNAGLTLLRAATTVSAYHYPDGKRVFFEVQARAELDTP